MQLRALSQRLPDGVVNVLHNIGDIDAGGLDRIGLPIVEQILENLGVCLTEPPPFGCF